MSNWIDDALAEAGKSPTGQTQRGAMQACPLSEPPFILVRAIRADNGEPIGGAEAKLEGPTPGTKRTATGTGVSVFDPVKPGRYRLTTLLSGSQAELFEPPAPAQLSVAADGFAVQIVLFTPLAKLKVRIFTSGDGNPPRPAAVAGVTVRATLQGGRGPLQRQTDPSGVADFGSVPAGNGRIEVQTSAAFPGRFSPVPSTSILLEATRELIVPIELKKSLELATSRGQLEIGIVGGSTRSTPLVVVPFPANAAPFILAQEFDDASSEDLGFTNPSVPPQTLAEEAITKLMEAGEFLTPLIPNTVKRETLMKAELKVAAGDDALQLVDVFVRNPFAASAASFGTIFDAGTSLSNRVRDSDEFKTEHEGVRSDIDNALKRQFVTGTIDFNKMRGVPQRDPKFKVPDFVGNPNGVKEPARVGFGLSASFGLAALIGDFQGCKVILKSFDVDRSNNTYRATLRYEFVEHFGLDNSDVNPLSSPGHGTPGQVAFWLLQHKSRPGHFPFRYLVVVEQEITGSLDPALSDPPRRGPTR